MPTHLTGTSESPRSGFWRCVESGETLGFSKLIPQSRELKRSAFRYERVQCPGGVRRGVLADPFGAPQHEQAKNRASRRPSGCLDYQLDYNSELRSGCPAGLSATHGADQPGEAGEVKQPWTAHGPHPAKEPKGRSRPKVIDKSLLALPCRGSRLLRYLEKLTAGKSVPENYDGLILSLAWLSAL